MADAGVQPTEATFHILESIYDEAGLTTQLEEVRQLRKTMAVLQGTRWGAA
jgi:hypothetical protein